MSVFANCSGFSEGQITTLAALRGGTSALTVMATIELLVVTCAFQSKLIKTDRRVKVQLFALFGVSITYLTVLSLGVVHHLLPDPSAGRWCEAFGFFDQLLSVTQITFLFIVFIEVFGLRGSEEKISRRKKWILRLLQGTVIFVAVLMWIACIVPFITGTYGEVGGWCWISSIDENCEVLVVGLMELVFLWIIYHALITLICILIVLTVVILSVGACIFMYSKKKERREYDSLGLVDDKHDFKHLLCKYIFQLIILVPMFLVLVEVVLVAHIHHYNFTVWVLLATAPPLSGFSIPLSFLLYIKFSGAGPGDHLPRPQNNPPARAPNRHSTVDLRGGIQEQAYIGVEQEDKASTTWMTADDNPSWAKKLGPKQLGKTNLLGDC